MERGDTHAASDSNGIGPAADNTGTSADGATIAAEDATGVAAMNGIDSELNAGGDDTLSSALRDAIQSIADETVDSLGPPTIPSRQNEPIVGQTMAADASHVNGGKTEATIDESKTTSNDATAKATSAAVADASNGEGVSLVKVESNETVGKPKKPIDEAKAKTPTKTPKKEKAKASPKRRTPNPFLKISREVLENKVDIALFLSAEDCTFLAENFWIFTLDQLAYFVCEKTKIRVEEGNDEKQTLSPNARREFLMQVASLMMGSSSPEEPRKKKARVGPLEDSSIAGVKEISESGKGSDKGETVPIASTAVPSQAPGSVSQSDLLCPETMDIGAGKEVDKEQSSKELARKVTDLEMSQAEERLVAWDVAIQKFRQTSTTDKISLEKSFHLDGAIRVLVPNATMNFLKSLKMETAWDFMSARRQENAPICSLMKHWRSSCGIEQQPSNFTLSKHFCGVASRIEAAISSIPPVANEVRAWMEGALNSLTGASRDFLIFDQGVKSASQFLTLRTKDLSNQLEAWRKRKGMEPLKGSGKVAMISSWKSFTRELLDVEAHTGSVTDLSAFTEEFNLEKNLGEKQPKRSNQKKNKVGGSTTSKAQKLLKSKEFLDSVLGSRVGDALASAGIKNGSDLFEADSRPETSVLYRTLVDVGVVDSVSSFLTELSNWKTSLTMSSQGRKPHARVRRVVKSAVIDSDDEDDDEDDAEYAEYIDTSPKRKVLKNKGASKQNAPRDPFEALSDTTKQFLRSIGVNTAEEFLSTRSTDISIKFIEWRIAEGKPELKGCGAVASVSGWKAIVRKKANERGHDDISHLEPKDARVRRMPVRSFSKTRISVPPPETDFLVLNRGPELSTLVSKTLKDDGCKVFGVGSPGNTGCFLFELSHRDASREVKTVFVTYRGFSKAPSSSSPKAQVHIISSDKPIRLPILEHSVLPLENLQVEDCFLSFSSLCACGGLVDLTPYHLVTEASENIDVVKQLLSIFVKGEVFESAGASEGNFNVFSVKTGVDTFRRVLYLDKALEKGQTIAVRENTIDAFLRDKEANPHSVVETALGMLSARARGELLSWLLEETAKGPEQSATFESIQKRNRRLHWAAIRVSALGCESDPNLLSNVAKLCRGSNTTSEQMPMYVDCVSKEIESEFMAFLDEDLSLGTKQRQRWFGLAQEVFQGSVSILSRSSFGSTIGNLERLLDSAIDFNSPTLGAALEKLAFSSPKVLAGFQEEDLLPVIFQAEPSTNSALDCHDVVVCDLSASQNAGECGLVDIVAAQNGQYPVALPWYNRFLAKVLSDTITAFGLYMSSNDTEKPADLGGLHSVLEPRFGTHSKSDPFLIRYNPSVLIPKEEHLSYVPESLPFFLDIVWPTLQDHGWSIVAGNDPSEIIFSSTREKEEFAGFAQHKRDRQKGKDSKALAAMGLGNARKPTKRLLVSVSDSDSALRGWTRGTAPTELSVKQILDRFELALGEGCTSDVSRQKVEMFTASVQRLFDAFSEHMTFTPGSSDSKPSEVFTGQCLVQLLLIVPDILRQVDLPAQDLSAANTLLHDLLGFVTKEHESVLPEPLHLPTEVYRTMQDNISSPHFNPMWTREGILEKEKSNGNDGETTFGNLIQPHDSERLSDFMLCVLNNAVPFHADRDDVERKKHRISVGTPGLVCKHCMGANYEGRYFFSCVESLTASYTCLEKHYIKCPKTPDTVKTEVVATRSRHAAQRKHIPSGSQQAYFNDLWDRFKGTKTKRASTGLANHSSIIFTSPAAKQEDPDGGGEEEEDSSAVREYSDHVELLSSLNKSEMGPAVGTALNRYYACLEYGGRVYQTKDMPNHFSSSWLLAKVQPKNYSFGG